MERGTLLDASYIVTTFTILLNGDVYVTDRLLDQISNSRVIAADGGMRHAEALNVVPELWMGDFDSSDDYLIGQYRNVPREGFPCDKDMTDGALACQKAIQNGAKHIILCGAFGSERYDHSLSHMAQALAMAEQGISVLLTNGQEEGWPILPRTFTYDLPNGCLFSIVGFTDLRGLTLSGAKWPLYDQNVAFGSSLTISNCVEGTLSCKLTSGRAMLLASVSG